MSVNQEVISLSEEEVNELIKKTNDAYSFDRYGKEAWGNSIKNLDTLGYNKEEIEWILNSKYMRWAGDVFAKQVQKASEDYDEKFDGTEIVKYRAQYGIQIEVEGVINNMVTAKRKHGI